MKNLPPPRISLIHRPESDFALIIRRGPTKQTAFFGWNRSTDEITLGQWLMGRVYPKRCDISPDGKHVIYFAFNGKFDSESKGSWTAVSKFPYLKALDFWPKGDAWNGGGLFHSNNEYLLHEHSLLHENHTNCNQFKVVKGRPASPVQSNECPGVYVPKLIRDNWEFLDEESSLTDTVYNFSKNINDRMWIQKKFHATSSPPKGKNCYYEEHYIHGVSTGRSDFRDVEYLDYYNGEIFWPENGKLFSGKVEGGIVHPPRTVHDFTEYKYQRIQAPY